jgi:hypothetical protein
VRRLSVFVDGKRTKVQRGRRRSVRVRLTGATGKRAVKIVARLRNGRTVVDRRTYRLCAAQA